VSTTTKLSPAAEAEIKAACQRIALDYSFYADSGRMDELSQLFAEDGEFDLFGQTHKGPAAIAKAFGGAGGGTTVSVHSVSNHRIDVVSETEARSTAYVTVFVGDKAKPAATISPFIVGTYHDVYKKTPAGWRFAKRGFETLIAKAN
jgi:hypothetical protein